MGEILYKIYGMQMAIAGRKKDGVYVDVKFRAVVDPWNIKKSNEMRWRLMDLETMQLSKELTTMARYFLKHYNADPYKPFKYEGSQIFRQLLIHIPEEMMRLNFQKTWRKGLFGYGASKGSPYLVDGIKTKYASKERKESMYFEVELSPLTLHYNRGLSAPVFITLDLHDIRKLDLGDIVNLRVKELMDDPSVSSELEKEIRKELRDRVAVFNPF